MGDLNFRLDDVTGDEIKRRIAEDQSESLLQHDQVGKYLCIGWGVEVLHARRKKGRYCCIRCNCKAK